MAIRVSKAVASITPTIEALCNLSTMENYLIGLTQLSGQTKRASYVRAEFSHFVILADQLSAQDAVSLEGALQTALRADKNSITARKYHWEKPEGRHYPSIGGSKKPNARFSIYMAWFDRQD